VVRVAGAVILPGEAADMLIAAIVVLHVLSGGAVQAPLQPIVGAFERRTGDRVHVTFGQVGKVRRAFVAGTPTDVVIVSAPVLRSLERSGTIAAGSARALGTTSIGVGVRSGAPLPDISTVAAFRHTLLAARAITYADPATSSSGAQVRRLIARLGLTDALRHKTVLVESGFGGTLVAQGRVSVVIQNVSEIVAVTGVTLAGRLPAALQSYNTYVAAISAHAAHPREARALIDALIQPAERARWRRAGFVPGTYRS
jgi:molybdate transport system substrate-binding protein